MDYRIKEILAKVENDLARPLTVLDLAASVNVSVSRFQTSLQTGNQYRHRQIYK